MPIDSFGCDMLIISSGKHYICEPLSYHPRQHPAPANTSNQAHTGPHYYAVPLPFHNISRLAATLFPDNGSRPSSTGHSGVRHRLTSCTRLGPQTNLSEPRVPPNNIQPAGTVQRHALGLQPS